LGRNPGAAERGEHVQSKLQVSLASASSRWAWPEQSKLQESRASSRRAQKALGEHKASSRKTQRRIEEGKH
jgi:hypothetical protein